MGLGKAGSFCGECVEQGMYPSPAHSPHSHPNFNSCCFGFLLSLYPTAGVRCATGICGSGLVSAPICILCSFCAAMHHSNTRTRYSMRGLDAQRSLKKDKCPACTRPFWIVDQNLGSEYAIQSVLSGSGTCSRHGELECDIRCLTRCPQCSG